MPNSLLSSESKLVGIRKDILEQIQNECRSRGQQLITELTDFTKAFRTFNTDIHALTWCSQKVGSPHPPFPAHPGPSRSHAQHTPFKSQLSSRWGMTLLNCAHMCGLPLPALILFKRGPQHPHERGRSWCFEREKIWLSETEFCSLYSRVGIQTLPSGQQSDGGGTVLSSGRPRSDGGSDPRLP